MNKYILAPSLLAADFKHLARDVAAVGEAGAQYLHLDVMDGLFVNNISFGIPVIQSLRAASGLVFDTHLMINDPSRYIEAFAEAGADIINIHVEASFDVRRDLKKIKTLGKKPAVTIKPDTAIETAYKYLDDADMVLLMSVEPGFGCQPFLPHTLNKAEALANYISKNNYAVDIEMDGGVTLNNLRDVLSAGVNVIVAGSSVFRCDDVRARVCEFLNIFNEFK